MEFKVVRERKTLYKPFKEHGQLRRQVDELQKITSRVFDHDLKNMGTRISGSQCAI